MTSEDIYQGDLATESLAGGTLLMVDDDENILAALKRLLRRDGYRLLTATSGKQGLDILHHDIVDVVISDQRMPEMTGVEFLRQAKSICPETVRIVLSGYTELASVTDAINEGAIYKFLTKPWDDGLLRASIHEAFQRKELNDENRRLNQQLRSAKEQLERQNERLQAALTEQKVVMQLGEKVLRLAKDGLDQLPIPVIGIDAGSRVAFVNLAAYQVAPDNTWSVGEQVQQGVPSIVAECVRIAPVQFTIPELFGKSWILDARQLGTREAPRGTLVTLLPISPTPQVGIS
jgi:FixJ family two-component response regulator